MSEGTLVTGHSWLEVNLVGVDESATVTPGRTKMVTGGDSKP